MDHLCARTIWETELSGSPNRKLGVGIVGLAPGRSWAAVAHLPAIAALSDDFEVVGVANSSLASAHEAVSRTGAGTAFDLDGLLGSPDVDVVAVTVKVSAHYNILRRAIAAGKPVYCEWPLTLDLAEARSLAEQAKEAGVRAVIGTQGAVSAEVGYLRHLVAAGAIGTVLSTTITAAAGVWGATVSESQVYSLDRTSGANILTVPFGHLVAMIETVIGPIDAISAELATGRGKVRVAETGAIVEATAPDQLAVAGLLAGGAVLSVHFRGGMPSAEGLTWEIYGTEGVLRVTGDRGQPQMATIRLFQGATDEAAREIFLPPEFAPSLKLAGPARNVGLIYQALAHDIRNGTRTAPDFDSAVRTHRVVAAVEEAASTHRRIAV